MIDWLISLMCASFVPELEDPNIKNEIQMTKLKGRLEKTAQLSLIPIAEIVVSPPPPVELPVVSGKSLLVSASSPELVERIQALDSPVLDVLLTGIIGHGNQRAAILTDGKKDHVVGVGGYVSNAFKVTDIGVNSVTLVPLFGKSREPIAVHISESKPQGAS